MNEKWTLLFYLVIEGTSLWFAYLARESQRKYSQKIEKGLSMNATVYLSISWLILFITAAMRNYVGTDYGTYVASFSRICSGTLFDGEITWLKQSPLFYLICVLCAKFGGSYQLMFACVAFVTLYFMYAAIIRSSSDWVISIYLYLCFCLYFQSFNQIRQMAAVAISLYALTWLQKNNIKKFVLWTMIATGFHMSVAVLLLILPIRKWKISLRNVVMYVLAGIMIYFAFPVLLGLFSNISYIRIYQESSYAAAASKTTILNLIVRIAMCGCCFLVLRKNSVIASSNLSLFNSAVLCTLFQVCAVRFSIFGRVTTYFFAAYILLIPEVLQVFQRKFVRENRKVVRVAFILVCFVYQMIYYFSSAGASGSGYGIYRLLGL